MMLELSLQEQRSISWTGVRKEDKENGTEHAKVRRHERVIFIMRGVKN